MKSEETSLKQKLSRKSVPLRRRPHSRDSDSRDRPSLKEYQVSNPFSESRSQRLRKAAHRWSQSVSQTCPDPLCLSQISQSYRNSEFHSPNLYYQNLYRSNPDQSANPTYWRKKWP